GLNLFGEQDSTRNLNLSGERML
ncbi:hypothetical protein A2U01_0118159, partial [Trifolium medium]|nr:hypothetical protein [Trifolium medium]